jgi:hypothetical protein
MKMLRSVILTLTLMCFCTHAIADLFGPGTNQFEIEFVEIGDAGNAADTTGAPNPAGAVDYIYNIGKFEVSRNMIEKANADGGLGLTLDPMGDINGGPRPDMPATGVSWNEAARFTNWLNTSQGLPPAYKFSKQPGEAGYNANANIELWVAGDSVYDAANPFRSSQAQYFLPSAHEWYKAAYYDPSANGGAGGYWNFPTGSDTVPLSVASGTDPATAVFLQTFDQGPADITQAGGLSPYGVMGLGGNVEEWEETEFDLINDNSSSLRGVRGGNSNFNSNIMSASLRGNFNPANGINATGFRVASITIPEPSSFLLISIGAVGLIGFGRRLRKRAV